MRMTLPVYSESPTSFQPHSYHRIIYFASMVASVAVWIGLFLLFAAGISFAETESDQDYVGTSPEPITPHLCHCSHITFLPDEESGTIKNPGYPQAYCNDQTCTYEIEPHPTLATVITIEALSMEERYDRLDLYHYRLVNGKMDKIFFTNLGTSNFKWFLVPPNVGAFINMTSDLSIAGTFLLEFTRTEAGSHEAKGYSCPYPFINTEETIYNISMSLWPPSGCSIRLISNNSITIRFSCTAGINVGMYIRATLPGLMTEYWTASVSDYFKYDRVTSTTDMVIRGLYTFYGLAKSFSSCRMTYFSLNYNPCNCSTTSYTMGIDDMAEVASPGFPNLFCPSISCIYKFTRENVTKDLKSAFLVSAIQLSHSYDDSLSFRVKGEEIYRLQSTKNEQATDEVIIAETMEIGYFASTQFKNLHGFTLTVKAVNIPLDCICPSNGPKNLASKGTYSMSIPPYCPDMNCRFVISTEFSIRMQAIRIGLEYKFSHENEKIIILIGNEERTYDSLGTYKNERLTAISDSKIHILYSRKGTDAKAIPLGPSSFNITWKWLSRQDCSCEDLIHMATLEWEEIFSPRYPEEYCLNMNCSYRIQAPADHHVMLNISFFETEPHSDYLYIFEGFNTSIKHSNQLSGHQLYIPLYESKGQNLSMLFITDGSVTAKGFVINFKAVRNAEVPEKEGGGGHGLIICVIILLIGMIIGATYFVYTKRTESFRNPAYIPSYRYSAEDEMVTGEEGRL